VLRLASRIYIEFLNKLPVMRVNNICFPKKALWDIDVVYKFVILGAKAMMLRVNKVTDCG
jgi:hypothetical protein